MRRLALIFGVLAVAGLIGLSAGGSRESERYRVAAVFDTAKGMVGGQQVKIAGAVVGKVEKVDLAPGPKARMLMSVERRFGPFRADATCKILPEGLISENYVECDPGTQARSPLAAGTDGTPTIPVERTAVPVSVQDVINVFSMPVDQRLRVLVNELGLGTAGRGSDINAILRRANPALSQARGVLSILDHQRTRLRDAVAQTDAVLAQLAKRDDDVRTFVDRAATVAKASARHRTALSETVRRLPGMLDAVRPGLRSVDRAAASTAPLLDHLRTAAPALRRLTRTLPAFAQAGVPAIRALADTAKRGRPALRSARPVVAHLDKASVELEPLAGDARRLLHSVRDTGGVEGTMRLFYTLATLTGAYDGVSHLISFFIQAAPQCLAAQAANRDHAGCSHKYDAPGQGTVPINRPECGPLRPEQLWRNFRCGDTFAGTAPRARHRHTRHTRADRRQTAVAPGRAGTPSAAPLTGKPPAVTLDPVGRAVGKLLSPGAQTRAGRERRPDQFMRFLDYLLK